MSLTKLVLFELFLLFHEYLRFLSISLDISLCWINFVLSVNILYLISASRQPTADLLNFLCMGDDDYLIDLSSYYI